MELRAIWVLNSTLWEIACEHTGWPIYSLLGERNRNRVRVYNPCVGSGKAPASTLGVVVARANLPKTMLQQI